MANGLAGAMFGGMSCAIAVDPTVVVDIASSYVARI